jgi:hypothetical protein
MKVLVAVHGDKRDHSVMRPPAQAPKNYEVVHVFLFLSSGEVMIRGVLFRLVVFFSCCRCLSSCCAFSLFG